MSISHSISRTTSFPVYGRPYYRGPPSDKQFSPVQRSAIADDGGVDELAALGGRRRRRQRLAVEGVYARCEGDARHQPNALRGKQISGPQHPVVTVVPFVARHFEQ